MHGLTWASARGLGQSGASLKKIFKKKMINVRIRGVLTLLYSGICWRRWREPPPLPPYQYMQAIRFNYAGWCGLFGGWAQKMSIAQGPQVLLRLPWSCNGPGPGLMSPRLSRPIVSVCRLQDRGRRQATPPSRHRYLRGTKTRR